MALFKFGKKKDVPDLKDLDLESSDELDKDLFGKDMPKDALDHSKDSLDLDMPPPPPGESVSTPKSMEEALSEKKPVMETDMPSELFDNDPAEKMEEGLQKETSAEELSPPPEMKPTELEKPKESKTEIPAQDPVTPEASEQPETISVQKEPVKQKVEVSTPEVHEEPKADGPLFIRISDFVNIADNFASLHHMYNVVNGHNDTVESLRRKQDAALSKWHVQINGIQENLDKVEHKLFKR